MNGNEEEEKGKEREESDWRGREGREEEME